MASQKNVALAGGEQVGGAGGMGGEGGSGGGGEGEGGGLQGYSAAGDSQMKG